MNVDKTNNTVDKVQELQRKLYLAAKGSETRRFHAIYDKVYRKDFLNKAWIKVKSNKGSAGIDNITIKEVEDYGVGKLIDEIHLELKENKYKPKPVKRVDIPKGNGKTRPLGIPTIKDRIVQTSAKMALEAIFEADFYSESYGFRPKRNQHQALESIRKACNNSGNWVLDADIKGYFNNIHHDKLMILIEKRVNDRRMLKLIRKWLKVGVMKDGVYEETEVGSPQGSPLSTLLSNIYLNYMDGIWQKYYSSYGKLIRFADDYVIICKKYEDVKNANTAIRYIMNLLGLTINEDKTKIISLWNGKQAFDFLGYHNKKIKHKTRNGREYYQLIQWISKKASAKLKDKVRLVLARRTLNQDLLDKVKELNSKIVGWRNYYGKSRFDKLQKLDFFINNRFVIWVNSKRKKRKRHNYYEEIRKIRSLGLEYIAYKS